MLDLRIRRGLPGGRPGGATGGPDTASGGGTTVRVGGVTLTGYLLANSLTMRLNSFDFAIKNPPSVPALGDLVYVLEPAWEGQVVSVEQRAMPGSTVQIYTITATNTKLAYASPAPFGLSDVPDQATTYSYLDLTVTKTVDDSGVHTRGRCTIRRAGLWPAMTFTLTSAVFGLSSAQFTVRNITVTWLTLNDLLFAIEFGDPIVTLSAWVANVPLADGTITGTMITDDSVTTPKIAANAVTAAKIAAGEISADKLAATLVLASLIKTAESGTRIEMDTAGVRAYNSTGDLLVNIPTDGSPVYVNGEIQASSLNVIGNAIFRGTANELAASSSTALASYQTGPPTAPNLSAGWPTPTYFSGTTGLSKAKIYGGFYDALGGANGATPCYVALGELNGNRYVFEWKMSDGTLSRTTLITGAYKGYQGWITRIGGYWYTCDSLGPSGGFATWLNKIDRTTGLTVTTSSVSSQFTADSYAAGQPIKADATFIYVAGAGTAANATRIVKFDNNLFWQTTQELAMPTPLAGYTIERRDGAFELGGGSYWVRMTNIKSGSASSDLVYRFDQTTGAWTTDNEFPVPIQGAIGFCTDGTTFYTITPASDGVGGWRPLVYQHTLWDWTTASSIYWVAYTWYDSAGTTHETQVGPRAQITMGRRQQLTVTMAPVPTGGVDDPNTHRLYMLPNATDPGATALKLQATTASNSQVLITYNGAGAADPAANGFTTVAAAAELRSAAPIASGGWSLKGDGQVVLGTGKLAMGGATFPASPSDDDLFYRTDLDLLFSYKSSITSWLTADRFTAHGEPLPATGTTGTQWFHTVAPFAGSDIYVERFSTISHVITTNNGTNFWTANLYKVTAAGGSTAIATFNTAADTVATWTAHDTSVNALVTQATNSWLVADVVKTLAPGNIDAWGVVTYRMKYT